MLFSIILYVFRNCISSVASIYNAIIIDVVYSERRKRMATSSLCQCCLFSRIRRTRVLNARPFAALYIIFIITSVCERVSRIERICKHNYTIYKISSQPILFAYPIKGMRSAQLILKCDRQVWHSFLQVNQFFFSHKIFCIRR